MIIWGKEAFIETSRKKINVVAALIWDGKRVFATDRGYGNYKGWWEFFGYEIKKRMALMERIRGTRMVKHVILWTLKDELSAEEKAAVKQGIKEGLEGLKGKVPGIVDIKVNIDGLESSNADLMLDSTFESVEALKGYSVHPEHVAVADSKVRPYTKIRSCLDFEV